MEQQLPTTNPSTALPAVVDHCFFCQAPDAPFSAFLMTVTIPVMRRRRTLWEAVRICPFCAATELHKLFAMLKAPHGATLVEAWQRAHWPREFETPGDTVSRLRGEAHKELAAEAAPAEKPKRTRKKT